jgi:transcriptional regulator with XRE-family HTH domain
MTAKGKQQYTSTPEATLFAAMVGYNIARLRVKANVSQTELAQKTGLPDRTIQNMEFGLVAQTAYACHLICLALGAPLEQLLCPIPPASVGSPAQRGDALRAIRSWPRGSLRTPSTAGLSASTTPNSSPTPDTVPPASPSSPANACDATNSPTSGEPTTASVTPTS